MVKFLKISETDSKDVISFLIENNIYREGVEKYFPFTFIIKEEEKILGLGILDFIDKYIVIKDIFVSPQYRKKGLGEGLLRTLLNFTYIKQNKYAYYFGADKVTYSYLTKFGFESYKDKYLFINIKNIFSKSCSCSEV